MDAGPSTSDGPKRCIVSFNSVAVLITSIMNGTFNKWWEKIGQWNPRDEVEPQFRKLANSLAYNDKHSLMALFRAHPPTQTDFDIALKMIDFVMTRLRENNIRLTTAQEVFLLFSKYGLINKSTNGWIKEFLREECYRPGPAVDQYPAVDCLVAPDVVPMDMWTVPRPKVTIRCLSGTDTGEFEITERILYDDNRPWRPNELILMNDDSYTLRNIKDLLARRRYTRRASNEPYPPQINLVENKIICLLRNDTEPKTVVIRQQNYV